jgi:hypothetical protein
MSAPKKQPTKPFTMVRRSLWDSRRFASLPDDSHRYLYLYFLTCEQQTQTGCFKAKPGYILEDLKKPGGDWTADALQSRMAGLVDAGLIITDDVTGEILVVDWWKDNGPSNESWFAGAKRHCEAISSQKLQEIAQTALEACWDSFLSGKGLPPRTGTSPPALRAIAQERLAAIQARNGGAM